MAGAATKQLTLFAEDRSDLPLKDDRALMEYPFFSLQKNPLMTPIVYRKGDVEVIVEPGPRGIATIWDKEILIYLASLLNERIERGETVSRTIQFVAADFLKRTKRGTGKRSYELFLDALDRLRNTSIKTTIASHEERERRGFGWIESWRAIEQKKASGKPTMVAIEVTINQWMFRAITLDRRVLTLNDEYFTMTKGLKRRLYELARKHCGKQKKGWSISLPNLKDKCGSNREIRRFKADVVKMIRENDLPEYTMQIDEARDPNRNRITFHMRATQIEQSSPDNGNGQETWALSADAHIKASEQHPGYDINYLEQTWRKWAQQKYSQPPKEPNKAFLSFCATYTKNNPL